MGGPTADLENSPSISRSGGKKLPMTAAVAAVVMMAGRKKRKSDNFRRSRWWKWAKAYCCPP